MRLLTRSAPLVTLSEVYNPDPKIAPHNLYKVPLRHLQTPLAPQFLGFSPLFLKNFSPNRAAHVRRALNRLAVPSSNPKPPEFRGKTAHLHIAAASKSPTKHPSRAPKTPPFTPLRIKKLSKVHSSLLTAPPRGCILEYMRLKAAAQATPHGAARAAPTASTTFKLTRLALEEAGH